MLKCVPNYLSHKITNRLFLFCATDRLLRFSGKGQKQRSSGVIKWPQKL